jgi:hypothetical protein
MCTEAEAATGVRPARTSSVDDVHAVTHTEAAVDKLGDEADEGQHDQFAHRRRSFEEQI